MRAASRLPTGAPVDSVHNLHSCSPELKASIDAHAATLGGLGRAARGHRAGGRAAVIVASLTEDAVLAAALLAQAALRLGRRRTRAKSSCTSDPP